MPAFLHALYPLDGFFALALAAIMHANYSQYTNISTSISDTLFAVLSDVLPNRFTNLSLSIVRIWSRATCPVLPLNLSCTLDGYCRAAVVIGAMIIVRNHWFISSGDIIRQGRVFWISEPIVGSRLTSQISNRLTPICFPAFTIATLFHPSRKGMRFLQVGHHRRWPPWS